MKNAARIAGATCAYLIAVSALAHGDATGIVRERMDGMSAMADVVKALSPMMVGNAAYDAAGVADGARKIAGHAGDAMTSKFPEGTAGAPSEARPEIWKDWDSFAGLARQLELFAKGLEKAADNGIGGMTMQGGMMGGGAAGAGMMGGSAMMGGAGMMGGGAAAMTVDQLGQMPADMAFAMLSQTCSACHTRFRAEDE